VPEALAKIVAKKLYIMRKLFYGFLALTIVGAIFIACTKENATVVTKENALELIKKDLSNKKYYPNVKNKYDYSSVNLNNFIHQNADLVNNVNKTGKTDITLDDYKSAVINFYSNTEHSAEEINQKFDSSKSLIDTYSDYHQMLDAFVANGTITQEERVIIDSYIDYFFSQDDYVSLCQVTSTYIYYINQSDFSEIEKRGMLTMFDVFKKNQELYNANEQFSFLPFVTNAPASTVNGRPSKDTECGGRIVICLVGGGILGNGLGACIGLCTALFENWVSGCFESSY
jgi:hypothetical protein